MQAIDQKADRATTATQQGDEKVRGDNHGLRNGDESARRTVLITHIHQLWNTSEHLREVEEQLFDKKLYFAMCKVASQIADVAMQSVKLVAALRHEDELALRKMRGKTCEKKPATLINNFQPK